MLQQLILCNPLRLVLCAYTGNTIHLSSKPVGNCHILVANMLTIREANRMKQGNIIVESDSQVAISSIMQKVDVSRQILNLVADIKLYQ